MKKISTLFKKNPNDLGRVINEINPENEWALTDGIPTRKYDGTAAAIIEGALYKRYDVKKGREVPSNSIPCQEPDPITGHWPHWVKCDPYANEDKYFFEALTYLEFPIDGTYELIGVKVQNNPERILGHELIKHGSHILHGIVNPITFETIREYLETTNIEGIVFHHKTDGRMCKIRKSDFGFKKQ